MTAMGQTRLDKHVSAQAWAAVEGQKVTKGSAHTATTQIPSIIGAAVVAEPQVNSWGERFYAVIFSSGTYLAKGVMCDGFPIRMGEWRFEMPADGYGAGFVILDPSALSTAAPGIQPFCHLQLFRLINGEVSGVSVGVPLDHKEVLFEVVGESILQQGEYLVAVRGEIDPKAEVVLGRSLRPVRRDKYITGETRFFFNSKDVPFVGALTLTMCQGGACDTQLIPRNPNVWGIPRK